MDELNEVFNNVKKLSNNIEQLMYLTDIKGKEYVKDYKLEDFQNIDKIVKICERCGKWFLPNFNFKQHQKYCDKYCRNEATNENRYKIKLDARQKPIDLLRKAIYETKYRIKRDKKQLDTQGLNAILKSLMILVKHRWEITEEEYNSRLSELQGKYETILQIGREN